MDDTARLAEENARDFAALGFDPQKTHIIRDTVDMGILYPLAARVAKRITLSTARAAFGFNNQTNIGMIFYTALQSAPCLLEDIPVLIPLGADQDPHFRLTRDVAPPAGPPQARPHTQCDGPRAEGARTARCRATDPNSAIYTTDDAETIRRKVNRYAFSGGQKDVQSHRRLGRGHGGGRLLPVHEDAVRARR